MYLPSKTTKTVWRRKTERRIWRKKLLPVAIFAGPQPEKRFYKGRIIFQWECHFEYNFYKMKPSNLVTFSNILSWPALQLAFDLLCQKKVFPSSEEATKWDLPVSTTSSGGRVSGWRWKASYSLQDALQHTKNVVQNNNSSQVGCIKEYNLLESLLVRFRLTNKSFGLLSNVIWQSRQ